MSRIAWFSFAAPASSFRIALRRRVRISVLTAIACSATLVSFAPRLPAALAPDSLSYSVGIARAPLDIVAFTSGSTVTVYTAAQPGPQGDLGYLPRDIISGANPDFGGAQLTTPAGIAVHPTTGAIYASDSANRIVRFNADRTFAGQIGVAGAPGSGNGQFNDPAGLCVDAAGNVYVADRGNHRIQKFNSAGTFVAKWGSLGTGNGQFNHPADVAVDASGNVYVADRDNHRVQKFSSAGAFIAKWGTLGSGNTQFNQPRSVAVDNWNQLYVADSGNDRLVKYTTGGAFVMVVPAFVRGAVAVATSRIGDVYAVDSDAGVVRLLDAAYVKTMGSTTPDGTYRSGAQINVQLTFNRAVAVTGTPRLQLETGAIDRFATYVSGSGTSVLNFTYTVVAGDNSPDLEFLNQNSLRLNGGTMIDADGHAADVWLMFAPHDPFSVTLGGVKNIVIDTTVPGAPSTPDLTAATDLGSSNTDNLTSDTTPTFIGTTEPNATIRVYRAGSTLLGSTTATAGGVWTFTVPAAAALANGTHNITARATNSLGNTGAASPALAVTIDTAAPAVTNISSTTGNGTYGAGDVIAITVTFNQPVTVNTAGGTPRLTLETGATDRTATYAGGSGTSTLTFNYTVQSGDNTPDLDYLNTLALALNGGTIRDASGNNATLTLPAPGAAGSLGANKALVISSTATPPSAPSTPDLAAASDTGVLNNDNLTRDTTPTFTGTAAAGSTVRLFAGGMQVGSATAVGGNWSITTSVLAPGTYSFTANATNAGGTSPASGTRAVTIAALIVDTEAELRRALVAAANGDTIGFAGDITLSADLPAVQRDLTIAGNNHTLDGANAYRGFFVYSGSVTVANLTITRASAVGGSAGPSGGGGAGLGGALFVRTGATVTVNNVSLLSNSAVGGAGRSQAAGAAFGIGGGGGMGGDGGSGGGGGLGVGADGGAASGPGGSGIVLGAAAGGAGLSGGAGGAAGGGGGGASTLTGSGGGGVGGTAGTAGAYGWLDAHGGAGGFGGGGGAGGTNSSDGIGGDGGFGGGGGSAGVQAGGGGGGNGGFGGGGGATFSSATGHGRGGFGGGKSSALAGGGGAGLGGAVFVMAGGTLNVAGPFTINGNSVTAGLAGDTGASRGSAFGAGAFLHGDGTITFSPATAQTVTLNDPIADQTGSGGTGGNAGAWTLVKNGGGTLVLNAQNAYSGGTTITGGIVAISNGNSLGRPGSPVTLAGGRLRAGGSIDLPQPMVFGPAPAIIEVNGLGEELRLQGSQSGPGAWIKTGNGTLGLAGVNTGTGTITISDGDVAVYYSGTFANHVVNNSALTLAPDGTLSCTGVISGSGHVRKRGPGTATLTGASSYANGTNVFAGTLVVGTTGAIGTGAAWAGPSATLRFGPGVDAGARLISIYGGGRVEFVGSSSAGTCTIWSEADGTITLEDTATAAGATIQSDGAIVDLTGLTAAGTAIGSITGYGSIRLGNKQLTTGGLNDSTVFSGTITGTGGRLAKTGTGMFDLTGASTYTGATTVSAGTLRVNNTTGSATGTGTVTVAAGATLAGSGRIGGGVIAQAAAHLEPGNDSIGTLDVAGDFTWRGANDGTATFDFDLSTTDVPPADRLAVGGAWIKGGAAGAAYRFDFGGTGGAGLTYTLVTFASTTFTAADFSYTNLPAGLAGTFTIVGGSLRFTVAPAAAAAPVVTLAAGSVTFIENAAALAIDPTLTVADADSPTLASATVRITTHFSAAQDALAAPTLQGNIAANYDSGTGILTLVSAGATATLAQWQATLRAVTYRNSSDAPTGATRTITFTVSDGANASSAASRTVVITAVNDAPLLSGGPVALTATDEDTTSDAALVSALLAGVTRTDADAAALSGIAITGTTGNGIWQYSVDGATWTDVGAVSASSALLLASTSRLHYVPDSANAENATLTFRAWDQTSGAASTVSSRNTASTTVNGGTTAFSSATAQVTLVVTAVNDAPVLTPAAPALAALSEDDTANPGQTVASIVGARITDVDTAALGGIAITAMDSTGGRWQFSLDGTTWSDVGTVSDSAALLLRPIDRVRFLPDGIDAASGSFAHCAWDQTGATAGAHGTKVDASTAGGSSAFSTASDTVTVTVNAANDAPTLSGGPFALTGTDENASAPAGTLVSAVLDGVVYADADPGALACMAVIATTGGGTWQYSTDGNTWTSFAAVSDVAALLLAGETQVRYLPSGTGETATFSFRAWDRTTGTASTNATRNTADTSTNGGTTSFSAGTAQVTITVGDVNDAPVLTPAAPALAGITEDDTTNSGVTIASLLGASVTDVDSGAVSGIALFASAHGAGACEFSLDGGATWNDIGTVSLSSALLLRSTDRIRFVPDALNGTTLELSYRAWDQTGATAGAHGTKVDASAAGGTTPFSNATDTAALTVTAVNDAPTLAGGPAAFPGTGASVPSARVTVADILDLTTYADVDTGALAGLAVTAATGAGNWQFSTDGTSWTNFGAVSTAAALLLDPSTEIRYSGDGATSETATFTFRAWDQTSGAAATNATRNTGDASANGASTAFSTGVAQATIVVTAVPPAPVVVGVGSPDDNGIYAAGEVLALTVAFNQPIVVSGTPGLQLNSGAAVFATYASGSGSTTLTFTYAVAAGESAADLDYLSPTALTLNGGTLRTPSAVDAVLTLPAPGAAGSLAANKDLVIDTTAPTITNAPTADGSYRAAFTLAITTATTASTYAATGLPEGLALDSATGQITGAPTQTGTFNVTLGATDLAGNSATALLALTIAPATVTVSGITASDKFYDGTTAATIDLSGATLGGVFPGDTVTLADGTGAFADAAVGTNKTVTITGLTLGGADAEHYQLAAVPVTATASISAPPPPPVTSAAVWLGNLTHVYDGTPKSASVSTSPAGIMTSVTYDGAATPPTNAGTYSVVAIVVTPGYSGLSRATLTIARAPQTIDFPAPANWRVGEPFALRATASSGLPVTFEIVSGNATLVAGALTVADATPVVVRASQPGDENHAPAAPVERTITAAATLPQTIAFAAPADRKFTAPAFPLEATASSGLPVTFTLVSGPATLADGVLAFSGSPGAITVRASQPGDAVYAAAPDVERTFHALPLIAGRFINLSARGRAGTGSRTFITGFVVGGGVPKPLLARAIGPSLAAFGVTGTLADPILRLMSAGGVVAENANWAGDPALAAAAERVGAFPLPPGSTDAALLATLNAGPHNALVAPFSANGVDSGVVLTELYAADPVVTAADQHFVNFSVRAEAGAGDNVIIVGFVVTGETPASLLARGVGPGLAPFGIDGALLADPRIQIFRGSELLASNDDATDDARNAGGQVGAFALAPGTKDAALTLSVEPGTYTIVLSGADATPGVALLEVYELP